MNVRSIELMVMERGLLDASAGPSTTLEDLVKEHDLWNYDFTVDRTVIGRDDWATTNVYGAREIWASKGVKGAV